MAFFDFLRNIKKDKQEEQEKTVVVEKPIASFFDIQFGQDLKEFMKEAHRREWFCNGGHRYFYQHVEIDNKFVTNTISLDEAFHLLSHGADIIGTYAGCDKTGICFMRHTEECESYKGVYGVEIIFPPEHFNQYELEAITDVLREKYQGYNMAFGWNKYCQCDVVTIIDRNALTEVNKKTDELIKNENERKLAIRAAMEANARIEAEKRIRDLFPD